MHGVIFLNLRKFIRSLTDEATTKLIYEQAGVGLKFYDATKSHSDEELVAILNAACKTLKVDRETALEEFGKFITPGLITTYKSYIKPEWKCMDLLEHVEATMHKAVRSSNPTAAPPALKITRKNAKEVEIEYTSPRKMISLGIGIIKKISEHYNEKVVITQSNITNGVKLTVKTA